MINLLRSLSVKQHLKITHLHQAVEGRSLVHRTGSYLPTKGRIKWIAPQKNNDVWYWNLLQWTLRWSQNLPEHSTTGDRPNARGFLALAGPKTELCRKRPCAVTLPTWVSWLCSPKRTWLSWGIHNMNLPNKLVDTGSNIVKIRCAMQLVLVPFFIEAASCLNRKAPPQKKTQNKTSAVLCKTWPHDHVTLAVICLDVVSTQALRPQPSRKKKMRKFELSQFDPEATA